METKNNELKTNDKTPNYLKRISSLENQVKSLSIKIIDLQRQMNNIIKALKR